MQRLAAMDRAQRMRLAVGAVLLVGVLVVAVLYGRQSDYRVLFANLSDKDGGAIVAQLTQMNGALQVFRGRRRHHDSRRPGARRAPASGNAGLAQGLGDGVRGDGEQPLWHDAVSGAAELSTRTRRRADPLDPGAVVGAKRARALGFA